MTRLFTAVYQLTRFIEGRHNMTIYSHLPGFKNQTQIRAKVEESRTFYNKDGLINCLRQPGPLLNRLPKSIRISTNPLIKSNCTRTDHAAVTESMGLPADAQLAAFFAHHLLSTP